MKKLISILFIFSNLLLILGFIFKFIDWPGKGMFMAIGLLGIFLFYLVRLIRRLLAKEKANFSILLEILITLTSPIFFSKYLYHYFGDYIGLVIIPIMIIVSLFFLIKIKSNDIKLITTSILYLILIIPLFIRSHEESPRQFIPVEWYDRYYGVCNSTVSIPYDFKFRETENLSIKAFNLKKSKKYFDAIIFYKKARNIEPENPRLFFELSNAYTGINSLEEAILYLDTAIIIDDLFAPFYNNRGLIKSRLKKYEDAVVDYQKSLEIGPQKYEYYLNLSIAYYYLGQLNKSCEAFKKGEKLGGNFKCLPKKMRKEIKLCE